MTKVNNLHELFLLELQLLHNGEMQIAQALPLMAEKTTNEQLRTEFQQHITETQEQAQKLEQAAQTLGVEMTDAIEDVAMRGILAKGEQMMSNNDPSLVLDFAMIKSAKHVEQYEIGGYKGAIMMAEQMGHQGIVPVLQEIMHQEQQTYEKLEAMGKQLLPQVPSGMND